MVLLMGKVFKGLFFLIFFICFAIFSTALLIWTYIDYKQKIKQGVHKEPSAIKCLESHH